MDHKIKILTSAMGLGTYIPALHIFEYLNQNDYFAEVEVFEEFLDESTLDTYTKTKTMFQSSYKAAVIGHKLAAKKLNFMLHETTMNSIINRWTEDSVDTFIILSGNWTSIVSQYIEKFPKVKAIIVHMDVGVAPSFNNFRNQNTNFTEIWPIDEKGVNYIVDNHFDDIIKAYPEEEQDKFFLHGGGWGMGTYLSKLEELRAILPNPMITTINDRKEFQPEKNIEYYMIDSNWKPWIKNSNNTFNYPHMLRVENDTKIIENSHSNGLYHLYHSCCSIISKPGGGTLMDSLITTTPIVFLEPIAGHEKINEKVWTELGFGLPYDAWKESENPISILQKMKEKLQLCKSNTPSLGERLIKEL